MFYDTTISCFIDILSKPYHCYSYQFERLPGTVPKTPVGLSPFDIAGSQTGSAALVPGPDGLPVEPDPEGYPAGGTLLQAPQLSRGRVRCLPASS